MFETMVYSSELISDLAFLFEYIEDMEQCYIANGLNVIHEIYLQHDGAIVLWLPYVQAR